MTGIHLKGNNTYHNIMNSNKIHQSGQSTDGQCSGFCNNRCVDWFSM